MTAGYDFSRSLPPTPDGFGDVLAQGLAAVAQADLAALLRASSPRGELRDRQAAVTWLAPRLGQDLDPERLLIANGTQSAVLLLLQTLVGAGQALASECLTYGMLRSLADLARVPVQGLPIDADGLRPDALDRVCAEGRIGAIYCNPTFHNPTATVMSLGRRREILAVAARHGVPVIEDDPLGGLYPDILPPPLAALAPNLVWHVAGLTKAIAQGLRVAYLVAPGAGARDRFLDRAERLSHWVAAPISLALATGLIESGRGQALRDAIAEENLAREAYARRTLSPWVEGARGSPHLWIPLPPDIERRLADALERDGVKVRGEDLFRVDDGEAAPSGIRLSLSSPRERRLVMAGLNRVRQHLAREAPPAAGARP